MNRRTLIPSVLILLGTVFIMLLLAEGAVRVLQLQGSLFTQFDAETGWAHRPNATGWYISPGVKAPVVINAQGLMGPKDYSYEKPQGKKRLLLLGDSFTESEQVPFEETWGHRLDEALGDEWEVLNAGVAGYGTDNALLYFRSEGKRFQPDAVLLLFFTGNDVSDNHRPLGLRIGSWQPQPYFTLERGHLRVHDFPLPPSADPSHSWLGSIKQGLRRRSMLYLFAHERIHRALALRQQTQPAPETSEASSVPLTWHVYRTPLDPEWQEAFALTEALLQQLAREVREEGATFSVAVMPTGWRVDVEERAKLLSQYPSLRDTSQWRLDQVDRLVETAMHSTGVPTMNLIDALTAHASGAEDEEPLFIDHLSSRGHQVAAGAIETFLREQWTQNPSLAP